ncbi:MAG: TolC family protein [Thermodesulfobacteriota bacterium]
MGQQTASASLEQYVEEALVHNDELVASQAAFQAAQAKIRRTGVLPDPVLGVQYYLEPVETRTGPQEAAISLSQRVPWPTKLSSQKKEVRLKSAIVESQLHEVQLKVVRRVKEIYIAYAFNTEARRITDEGLELLRYFESVALTRYSAGKLDYGNVLKVQVELARLEERQRSLHDQIEPLQGQLNSVLGASREIARTNPAQLPSIIMNVNETDLYNLARQKSPKLSGAEKAVKKAKSSLEIAESDFYPDLAFSLKTIITDEAEFADPPDSGRDPVIAGITMSIPLFRDRRNGAVAEKQQEIRAARGKRQQQIRNLDAAIDQGLFRYRDAQRRHTLYQKSVIPKIRQEVEVGLQAFQDGRRSVLSLLDAEKNLLELELDLKRALADQALEVARLEELVGVTLADWHE